MPIIGNIHQLVGGNPLRVLEKLAKIYGSIMTLRLGQVTTVVISSSDLAKQVLQEHDIVFSNRPVPNAFHAHNHYQYLVFWLPVGNRWRSIRKFFHSTMFSGNRLDMKQNLRHEKITALIDYAKRCGKRGAPIDVRRAGFVTSLNILSDTLFSVVLADYDEDDNRTRELKELREKALQVAGSVNLVDFFPLLKYIDPQGIRRRMKFHIGKILQSFDPFIGQKLEQSSKYEMLLGNHDAMDILFKSSEGVMDKTQIEWICLDLFLAGTSGTSAALEWAMAELTRNPEVLKKAKAELELVVGKGKTVEESHIPNLPYLNAIVKETLRMHPTAPLVPRKADVDVEINGYIIPKGTQVYVNLLAIGRDPHTWPNPNRFVPERFIGSKVDLKGHNFELIPFGAGRRICPGMSLSLRLRTLPVMLGSLVDSFDWKLEGGIGPEDIDMEEKFAVTFHKAQPLRIIPINS